MKKQVGLNSLFDYYYSHAKLDNSVVWPDNHKSSLQCTSHVKRVCSFSFLFFRQAEDLIHNGFPRKIVELNDLLATPLFTTENLEDVHEDLKVPVPPPVLANR